MPRVHCRQCLATSFALELPPERALVYAVSAGGVEVASAVAFFQAQPIVWLQPHELSDSIARRPEVAGHAVLLVDDGLTRLDQLMAAALALRNGGPARLQFVTPWLSRGSREKLIEIVDIVSTTLSRPPRRVPYDLPASDEIAHTFVAQAAAFHATFQHEWDLELASEVGAADWS